jgi:leucyl-tRNA synthetase
VSELGADTVRAYLMFLAPWEQGGEWNDSSISGISRWLNRIWQMVLDNYQADKKATPDSTRKAERELSRFVHQTIRKATEDIEKFRFNIMLSALMEYTNYLARVKETGSVSIRAWEEAIDILLRLLAPTAPHITEELWERTRRQYSIHNQPWPQWDKTLAKDEEITLVVQVNGKLRDRITVPASITEDELPKILQEKAAKANDYLKGKKVLKRIYVPGRLINFVVQ